MSVRQTDGWTDICNYRVTLLLIIETIKLEFIFFQNLKVYKVLKVAEVLKVAVAANSSWDSVLRCDWSTHIWVTGSNNSTSVTSSPPTANVPTEVVTTACDHLQVLEQVNWTGIAHASYLAWQIKIHFD